MIVLKVIGAFLLYAIALVPFWLLVGWYLNRVAERKAVLAAESAPPRNPDTLPHSASAMQTRTHSHHTAALPSPAAAPMAAR